MVALGEITVPIFATFFTLASLTYTVVAAIWLIYFGEYELTDWRLLKHVLASAGIANIAWTLKDHPEA